MNKVKKVLMPLDNYICKTLSDTEYTIQVISHSLWDLQEMLDVATKIEQESNKFLTHSIKITAHDLYTMVQNTTFELDKVARIIKEYYPAFNGHKHDTNYDRETLQSLYGELKDLLRIISIRLKGDE